MTETFRAPSRKVLADLKRMFECVGLPHPYGPPLTIEDLFNLIAEKQGPEVAARCVICVTYH